MLIVRTYVYTFQLVDDYVPVVCFPVFECAGTESFTGFVVGYDLDDSVSDGLDRWLRDEAGGAVLDDGSRTVFGMLDDDARHATGVRFEDGVRKSFADGREDEHVRGLHVADYVLISLNESMERDVVGHADIGSVLFEVSSLGAVADDTRLNLAAQLLGAAGDSIEQPVNVLVFRKSANVDDIPVGLRCRDFLKALKVDAVLYDMDVLHAADFSEVVRDVGRDWDDRVGEYHCRAFDHLPERTLPTDVVIPIVVPYFVPRYDECGLPE